MKSGKWAKRRVATGISSIVPERWNPHGHLHYILLDVDDRTMLNKMTEWAAETAIRYNIGFLIWPSKNGLHGVIFARVPLWRALQVASTCPGIDEEWLRIGKERGHLFLASYYPLLSDCFTYEVIWRKNTNTQRPRGWTNQCSVEKSAGTTIKTSGLDSGKHSGNVITMTAMSRP